MLGQGPLERCEGSLEIALRGSEQAAAAGGPGAVAPGGPLGQRLVLLDVDPRLLRLAQPKQRLDRIGPDPDRGVAPATLEQPPGQLAQVHTRRVQISERELEMAEHAEGDEHKKDIPVRLEQPERLLGCGARPLHVAEIRQRHGLAVQAQPRALPHWLCSASSRACAARSSACRQRPA